MKTSSIKLLLLATLFVLNVAYASEFRAYYTKLDTGESFEKVSRTGDYADILVEVNGGKFAFWRGASFLPYWESGSQKWFVEELVKRTGDGDEKRPDKVNTFSRVMLIESSADKAVVYWRYLPKFSGTNPHIGVDATKFVEEYFTIYPDGKVERQMKQGTSQIDAWRNPKNATMQSFRLTEGGIGKVTTEQGKPTAKEPKITGAPVKTPRVPKPLAWWRFDEAQGDETQEQVSGHKSNVVGHKSLWKQGVSGTALQFDGYNSIVRMPASQGPKPTSSLSLESWIAIGAYPWSWTPIIQQADDPEEVLVRMEGPRAVLTGEEEEEEEPSDDFTFVIKKEDDRGYFLGLDGLGHPGFKLRIDGQWEELVSKTHLERWRWYHIVGSYDGESGVMKLYVDGKRVGEKSVGKGKIELSAKDIKIGKGKPRRPIKPVRANTFMDSYGFDGLIDEVKIYDVALKDSEVAEVYEQVKPSDEIVQNANMEKRVLPAGKDTGQFGAYYTRLDYYETWDNLWRFGDHPDVVVEFDDLPTKFVFWRGVGYIPMLVNEKGQWYTNEFNETWGKSGGQGCQEPMSDKESYTNHAKIIENTPARVVVQWRYPLLDVLHVTANYDDKTGWGDWSDWYYYIYPDGVAVKTMRLWTDGERNHEWQESIAVFGPDQHPENVIETAPALIMVDLKGNVDEYDWVNGPPDEVDYEDTRIHVVNYHSDYDPVTIGEFRGGNVYGGELTDYAVFPTWNHWPVGQMPSDGRYASFPDRTGHSSLTHVFLPTYKADKRGPTPYQEKILMEGMLNQSTDELVVLAKSWLNPAPIEIVSGCKNAAYDRGQRAYVLEATDSKIVVKLNASEDSPLVNPAFVISNWEGDATLTVNGDAYDDFRIGHPRTVIDKDVVIWVKGETDEEVILEIRSR